MREVETKQVHGERENYKKRKQQWSGKDGISLKDREKQSEREREVAERATKVR